MSKNKQKSFLVGYGVVTGVAALGLLYMGFDSASARDAKIEAVNKKAADIRSMKKAPLYPKSVVADNMKTAANDLVAEADKLHADLQKLMVPWEAEVDGTAVQGKLIRLRDQLVKTAKDRGRPLPEGFALGLERYMEKAPTKSAALQLNFILESMNKVITNVLTTGAGVDKVAVLEADWEKAVEEPAASAKSGSKSTTGPSASSSNKKSTTTPTATKGVQPALPEDSVLQRYRVTLQISGSEQAVQNTLNTLATSGEGQPFLVVKSFRVENERKEGPTRMGNFNPVPIKDEKAPGEAKDAASPTAVDIDPEVQDILFVLGSEKVSAFLDLDLVLFLSGVADGINTPQLGTKVAAK